MREKGIVVFDIGTVQVQPPPFLLRNVLLGYIDELPFFLELHLSAIHDIVIFLSHCT